MQAIDDALKIFPLQKFAGGADIRNFSDVELIAMIMGTGTKQHDVF